MKILSIILSIGALFLMSGCEPDGHTSPPSIPIENPKPFTAPEISEGDKAAYLEAVNNARSSAHECGDEGNFSALTTPLVWSDSLYRASYEHSYDMAQSNTINSDHTGSNTDSDHTAKTQNLNRGSTMQERIENNGYKPWEAIGENLTVSNDSTPTDTPEKAVQKWLESPKHCANLMNPYYKEMGMAFVKKSGTGYTHFWTQDFGIKNYE